MNLFPFESHTNDYNTAWGCFKIHSVKDIDIHYSSWIAQNVERHDGFFDNPYWAEIWPSSFALIDFLVDNTSLFENKRVAEIGCGLGLISLVVSKKAQEVVATDIVPDALWFAQQNALLNSVTNISFRHVDIRQLMDFPHDVDFIVASDVLFDRMLFDEVETFISHAIAHNKILVFAEPNRSFAQPFVERLCHVYFAKKQTSIVIHNGVSLSIHILVINAKDTTSI